MTVLVRALSHYASWRVPPAGYASGEIPCEFLRPELNAFKDNALSFWEFKPDSENWQIDAALCLLGTFKTLVTSLEMVWIELDKVAGTGIAIRNEPGDNCFPIFRPLHRDVCLLDGVRLGAIAKLVGGAAVAGGMRTFTRQELREALSTAVDEGKLANRANLYAGHKALLENA